MEKIQVLRNLRFGERVAEEEMEELERYFVFTDQWQRVYEGEVDVIYGSKGAGKSAIYTLINKKENDLFDRDVIVTSAENVRGATIFQNLTIDPPPTERAFVDLWKLYILVICGRAIREFGVGDTNAKMLVSALEDAKLLPANASLGQLFSGAKEMIWSYFFPDRHSVEWTIAFEPSTGMPVATRKTVFRERGGSISDRAVEIPLDDLLLVANMALEESRENLWILFDRLDVAFNDSPEIEKNALRALFRVYNDLKGANRISLKIFVRDDIWDRISEGGFSEASHITRTTHINWSEESLLNLFVRRLISNRDILEYLSVEFDAVHDDFNAQKGVLERIFPEKVETGRNPTTFRWMINRIVDASGQPAPRELIHLAECIRREQISRLERGEAVPEGEILFDRTVFKTALQEVSKVRYEQTFVAENPSLKSYTDKLKNKKCEQNIETLQEIWNLERGDALNIAKRLCKTGFFQERDTDGIMTYWVPFIYRDILALTQGKEFDT